MYKHVKTTVQIYKKNIYKDNKCTIRYACSLFIFYFLENKDEKKNE